MATVYTYLPGFKTGAGLGYPVVLKAGGLNIDDYILQMEVKDSTEIAIGDIVMVLTGNLTLDATVAKDFTAFAIVMDTNRNKAILESHAVTVSKTGQFTSGDKIDILLLVPGMVLSMKYDGVVACDIGDDIRAAAAGEVAVLAAIATDADPRAKLGMCLTLGVGTGTAGYIAVMVK